MDTSSQNLMQQEAAIAATTSLGRTARFMLIAAGCLALAMSAVVKVPVPGTDVPGTLQLLAVISVGLWLAPRDALAATGSYLMLGTLGLPVFAAGSLGLWGQTGGYLIGFMVAAMVVSTISGRSDRAGFAVRAALAAVAGLVIVLTCGTVWRAIWLGSLSTAFATSVMPFLIKGMAEAGIAWLVAVSASPLLARTRK
ncbi:MAG: biotin transporter BioY [Phycisphaerae bacterium]